MKRTDKELLKKKEANQQPAERKNVENESDIESNFQDDSETSLSDVETGTKEPEPTFIVTMDGIDDYYFKGGAKEPIKTKKEDKSQIKSLARRKAESLASESKASSNAELELHADVSFDEAPVEKTSNRPRPMTVSMEDRLSQSRVSELELASLNPAGLQEAHMLATGSYRGMVEKPAKPVKETEKQSKVLQNQNFFEIYKALSEDNYTKMTTCPSCQRKFRFTSVLIEHMASHYGNNLDIVEMRLKIWNNGSKLKCAAPGCKKSKYVYTLDYTKHRDNHLFEGLSCSVCGAAQSSPKQYSDHLVAEHKDHLFSTESHQDDLVPPPSAKKKDPPVWVAEVVQETPSPAPPITPGYTEGHQVLTPLSAPPIMTASPGGGAGPLSQPMSPVQQPMSTTPTDQFSEAEMAQISSAISNMPILETETETINTGGQTEETELMSILEDLTDLNPSTSELSTYTSPQEPVTPLTPGPQPVILSAPYSPAPAAEPREAPPVSLTLKEQPSVRAGVIKRHPSFSAEAAPSYTPRESSASSRPLNMAAPTHPPLASYTSPSPLVTHSYPYEQSPLETLPTNGVMATNIEKFENFIREEATMQESSRPSRITNRNLSGSGTGSHPSSLTRALLADSIRRKSRSLSSDSLPSMSQNDALLPSESIEPNGNFIETNIQL